ncbi:protein Shroom1 [Lepisosteus oculatus]|uniref:protein Shroom1 n=1 Tax=Lepisosteus oculatus TaxID=7918 RepID=UPI0035F50E51
MHSFGHDVQFENMNSLNLNPLGLLSSDCRLSPATSSIDQFTHHHGKGDSAYSSFSGGSNAPDHSSPSLPDEMQPHSLHYTDLKYVRAVYNPNVLNSSSRNADHLYRSAEVLGHQCHEDSCLSSQYSSDQGNREIPPQPPSRLDSFITIRNLENSSAYQSPGGQLAETFLQRTQTANPALACPRTDPVYRRRVSESNLKDPVYRDGADQTLEQAKLAHILSNPSFILQESFKWHAGGTGSHSEDQSNKCHSAYGSDVTEQAQLRDLQQNTINGNIQHKGQYYFVTGVCKPTVPRVKDNLSGNRQGDCMGHSPEDLLAHKEIEEKAPSTIDELLNNAKHRQQRSYEIHNKSGLTSPGLQAQNREGVYHNKNMHSASPISNTSDILDQSQKPQGREIGSGSRWHHSSNHHIFYCGPEDSVPLPDPNDEDSVPPTQCTGQVKTERGDCVERMTRRPLGEVANDKINKETTPMLYRLAGESRGALAFKTSKENWAKMKWKEIRCNSAPFLKLQHTEATSRDECHFGTRNHNLEEVAEDLQQSQSEDFSSSGSSTDEFYKKYYKDRLKDAQTKVLRETSFKRKDLQLSWPHRIKQRAEERPSVMHSRLGSLSHTSQMISDNPVLLEPEPPAKRETGKPSNPLQPQAVRIGGRKRLTPEQKKLCYSEPEKLNQLGGSAHHSEQQSLGNEGEGLLSKDDLGEYGLVAARRKMFEMRGRTMSASSISKSTLKQIQHKALVAYVERKTGQKKAEPQQPPSQNPAMRHSTAGKPLEFGPRPTCENAVPRKKLTRPLSAGRVLDSSSSSIRYAQSDTMHPVEPRCQPIWKKMTSASPRKMFETTGHALSISVESLLEQSEQKGFHQSRTTPSPTNLQPGSLTHKASPVSHSRNSSSLKKAEGQLASSGTRAPAAEGRPGRTVTQRGKSMEELGTSRVPATPVLSKSSEQLDQIHSRHVASEHMQGNAAFSWEAELKIRGKAGESKESTGTGHSSERHLLKTGTSQHSRSSDDLLGATPNGRHSQSLEPLNFDMEPPNLASSPESRTSSTPIESPNMSALFCDSVESSVFYTDSPSGQSFYCRSTPERESVASTSTHLHIQFENGPEESTSCTRMKTTPTLQTLPLENVMVDQQESGSPEVSLGRGVTTDPSAWPTAEELGRAPVEDFQEGAASDADELGSPLPSLQSTGQQLATTSTDPAEKQVQNSEKEQAKNDKGGHSEEQPSPSTSAKPHLPKPGQWEELVEVIVTKDQSLASVLAPKSSRRTTVTLMEQLLSEDTLLMEEHYRRKRACRSHNGENSNVEGNAGSRILETPPNPDNWNSEVHSGNSSTQETVLSQDSELNDITEKKKELILCIQHQLQGLEKQRSALREELRANGELGSAVEALVRDSCQPSEYERYTLFIGDLEKVVSLLLCLSARLARVQNALSAVDQFTDAEEKQSLDERHRLLCKQRDDAKDLKDNLDRRERLVSDILSRNLTQEQLQDYKHFVKVKASLLIEQKDLEEKIRIGEEQLESLRSSMPF